jgi:hypothetical protein
MILSVIPTVGFCWGVSLPIAVISRDSIFGKGKVAIITNTSGDYLHECAMTINSASRPNIIIPTLEPHATKEIGWLELREELNPNSHISISCQDYLMPFTGNL